MATDGGPDGKQQKHAERGAQTGPGLVEGTHRGVLVLRAREWQSFSRLLVQGHYVDSCVTFCLEEIPIQKTWDCDISSCSALGPSDFRFLKGGGKGI